jgi:hypothetical protein
MAFLDYQRTVIAYHGTDAGVVESVLAGTSTLEYSQNKHDWLGKGIYFWEHGPRRAFEWAQWRIKGGGGSGAKIKTPAIIGALINLGNCFDLLDTRNTALLGELFPIYNQSCIDQGFEIPENKPSGKHDIDHTKRFLDCAVVNWVLELKEKQDGVKYHTVRCIFSEGKPAFEGSSIMEKSHIQIAVRDPSVVLGYFKPKVDFADS